jgi:OOP family OmpA-OmpF porin
MKRLVTTCLTLCINMGSAATYASDYSTQASAEPGQPDLSRTFNLGETGTFGAVLFRTDSAEIEQALWPVLRGAVRLAMEFPDIVITLEGHADARGSRNHNRTLSHQRVRSVAGFLIRNGISPNRIRTHAYGETRASANIQDISSQFFDRRVTIRLRAADASA